MRAQHFRQSILSLGFKVFHCQPVRDWSASYIPLNLRVLMAGERLTFNLFLKINDGEDFKYFPYMEEGEVLDAKWLAPLARMDIKHLYFQQKDLDQVLAYLNNHLQLLEMEGAAQSKKKLNVLGEHLNLTLRQTFSAPRLGPHIKLAEKQVDRIIEEFNRDKLSPKMVWEILYRNYSLYNHSVNVCLLAVAMMLFLGKSNRESRLLGSAALFIDLGMTRISERILNKAGGLTPEEWEETKKHPLIGKQMLRGHSSLPAEGGQLILEHHENADGSGYPEGLSLTRQHPWTRILRLLDAYDAFTTFRPHRPAQTPFATLKFLQKQEGPRGPVFEPRTLMSFIRFLALA